MNQRAAEIHIIGDLIQSVGVIIAAGVILYKEEWKIVDPICTFLFSIIVFFTTTTVVKQCMNVIMEAVPTDVNLDNLKRDLLICEGAEQVHDLHVWELTAGKMVLTCHVVSRTP